jgi:hypothetical protein
MNNSANPLNPSDAMSVFRAKQNNGGINVLDVGTLATAVLVATSPFIFMGYVKYVVHRAEAHLAEYTQNAEK